MHLILLPGLDGTGRLFSPLLDALPSHIEATVVRYPLDQRRSYAELIEQVKTSLPTNEPYVIAAESFSGPIAVRLAANSTPNLRGLILCASFVYIPWNFVAKAILRFVSHFMFLIPPPRVAVRYFLAGDDASDEFLERFYEAVSTVSRSVLSHRLRSALTVDERLNFQDTSVPVLYLFPKRDRLMRRDGIDVMRHIRGDITIVHIDAPHFLLQRKPDEAMREIERFIVRGDLCSAGTKVAED